MNMPYFMQETRRLEEDERRKLNVSQAVLTNRSNQKRHAVTLLKNVLRNSSSSMLITSECFVYFVR